jgi:Tfp pilus assembly protein PilE
VFVPYANRLSADFGFLIVIYVMGVLAAFALPAYQDYTTKAKRSLAKQC